MKLGKQTIVFLAVNKNGDEVILDNFPVRQGEVWTDERRRMTRNIFPSRITTRRSYFQKAVFIN